MKTEFHSMRTELETAKWPLDPAVIPNHMGINLCSIDGMSWTRQEDGQLVSLTIHFCPAQSYSGRENGEQIYGQLKECPD
jgi:hypothetical protein